MLKIGDYVVIANCAESQAEQKPRKVLSPEYQMCGCTMVQIEGKPGGYDVDCLVKVNI